MISATSAENRIRDLRRIYGDHPRDLTSSKYAKLTRSSQDTASRDLTDLVAKKVLRKGKAGGRSTHFVLAV